ncbi:hypothetical protein SCP_0103330 [Sparassis crispa]|uniref:Reverse transcriptase RNase H-like domain-containing protein n=1 Tax=Sparassis crispa TaxID=139825 RepID=A0A401G5M0_9APHY|nr:hypothetical protein SCP_0103330 [Sparassis crispa]GBE77458.1 hypothetical protein SCP_0103330 [Sparassis crispa]
MDVSRAKYRSKIDLSDAYEQIRPAAEDVWKTVFSTPYDSDKMSHICEWRIPRSYKEVQQFLGLVNYLGHFMPDVMVFTSPLSDMAHNDRAFVWRPMHTKCFEMIKALACKAPILKPIDSRLPEPIWVISDASLYGIGAMYRQGPDWRTCRPTGFLSKKFTSAQRAYKTYEHEALTILEALLKWEDKLLCRPIMIATDHQALKYFEGVTNPMNRQIRWNEYMSRFQYKIQDVEGATNKVADCLSRYYENDNADEFAPIQDYVNADVHLDPEWDDLPSNCIAELRAGTIQRSAQLPKDVQESRDQEASEMASHLPLVTPALGAKDEDPTIAESRTNGPPLKAHLEQDTPFLAAVQKGYGEDPLFTSRQPQYIQYPHEEPALLCTQWITNPTSSSMFDKWVAWYAQNPSQVHWAIRHLKNNHSEAPLHQDLEVMWLARHMAPIIPPGIPATARNVFIEHTAELFSIPGLYVWIVQVGHYPVANNNKPAPFPRSFTQNLSVYNVAQWYAARGFHPMRIGFLEKFHRRHRNYILGQVLEDVTPFEGHFPADLRDGRARPLPDPKPPTPSAGNAPAGSSELGPNPGATPEAGDPDHDMGGH